jgi:hypothetical protein
MLCKREVDIRVGTPNRRTRSFTNTVRTQLEDHVHILFVFETFEESHDVRMYHHPVNLDLGVELYTRALGDREDNHSDVSGGCL